MADHPDIHLIALLDIIIKDIFNIIEDKGKAFLIGKIYMHDDVARFLVVCRMTGSGHGHNVSSVESNLLTLTLP